MNCFKDNHLSIAIVGTYIPRRCGIATFTNDIYKAVKTELTINYDNIKSTNVNIIVIDDMKENFEYPEEVTYVIREQFLNDYIQAAEFINLNKVDLVIIQHEFGIFGGPNGKFILELLKNLRMPIFSTFHTVLKNPSTEQKIIIK